MKCYLGQQYHSVPVEVNKINAKNGVTGGNVSFHFQTEVMIFFLLAALVEFTLHFKLSILKNELKG